VAASRTVFMSRFFVDSVSFLASCIVIFTRTRGILCGEHDYSTGFRYLDEVYEIFDVEIVIFRQNNGSVY